MASFAHSSFPPTRPHFFSIVLQQTLLSSRLKIPKKIVRKCGSSLGDDVLLKLPCGSEWKLGLTKSSEGSVYIDKGWDEFSKHYSIGKGHLLMLRYDGDSRFHVVIFDTTTAEIDYVLKKSTASETLHRDNPAKEEVIEISGDEDDNLRVNRKRKRECHFNGGQSRDLGTKARRKGEQAATEGDRDSRLSVEEKAQALSRTSGFKSKHPYFKIVIQPPYVNGGRFLNLPLHFAQAHLGVSKLVVLRDPNGRSWPVNYNLNEAHLNAKLAGGWQEFARENDLKRGDVCIFVMTKSVGTFVFNVSFYKDNGAADSASEPVKSLRDHGSFESENKLFSVYMHASYINYCLSRIPDDFARTYMKKTQDEVRLCVSDGRFWSVHYKTACESNGRIRHYLAQGWPTFRQENGLEEGDICSFKLTNKNSISFDVRIVKPTDEEYEQMHKALGSKRTKPLTVKHRLNLELEE